MQIQSIDMNPLLRQQVAAFTIDLMVAHLRETDVDLKDRDQVFAALKAGRFGSRLIAEFGMMAVDQAGSNPAALQLVRRAASTPQAKGICK